MLTISFRTDTPAFDGQGGCRAEAARLLRVLAQRLADGHSEGAVTGKDGVRVGGWSLADHREMAEGPPEPIGNADPLYGERMDSADCGEE